MYKNTTIIPPEKINKIANPSQEEIANLICKKNINLWTKTIKERIIGWENHKNMYHRKNIISIVSIRISNIYFIAYSIHF